MVLELFCALLTDMALKLFSVLARPPMKDIWRQFVVVNVHFKECFRDPFCLTDYKTKVGIFLKNRRTTYNASVLVFVLINMSHVMRKPAFCIYENKGAP